MANENEAALSATPTFHNPEKPESENPESELDGQPSLATVSKHEATVPSATRDGTSPEIKDDVGAGAPTPPAGPGAPNATEYIEGFKLYAVVASLTMAVFLMLLDSSIVGTATPYITDDFHAVQDVGWYGSAYQLASAPLQPLTGKIYQKFSLKWVFLTFFAIFELGSVICGAAQSSTMLIVGRAVAGMGGSGLFNGSMTILVASAPLRKRPPLMGILMGVSQLGVVCGPLIGGALTQYASWRWCFYINLPVGGVFALFLLALHIPEQAQKPSFISALPSLYKDLDLLGFALLAPAAIMLLLALAYGGVTYPWHSSVVIGLFVGSGATFAVWLAWNYYRGDGALVPVYMITKRVVWASALTQTWLFTTLFLISYFLPIYFQAVKGAGPSLSGVYILPNILGQLLTALLSGFAVNKTGYLLPYILVSCAMAAVGTGLLALFQPGTSTGEWVGFQLISGLGRGLGMQMCLLAVQTVLKPFEIPVAMSLLMFFQYLGTGIFLELGNTIFDALLRSQLAVHAPGVDADAILAAGATKFREVISPQDVPGVVQAYADSVDPIYILAAAAAAAGFVTAPFIGLVDVRKKNKPPPPKGPAAV